MSIKKLHHFGKLLFVLSLFSGFFFSSIVSADDSVIDDVNVAVPASCSLSGTGMTSHNAAINNGTYNSAIGETTMTAFCNDNEGFAVYAIGYTDDTDGKNVLTSNSLGSTYDIVTGTATSGSNSNWAMKLSTITSPNPTYPITIENSFNNFHNVPNDYTLVAKRTSATDIGQNAEGSTLKSTYQAYISKTQAAGTYIGQVKYVLVHPNNTEETPVKSDQIAVIYDGNDLTFQGGAPTNKVIYERACTDMYAGNPTIVKSSNVAADGTKNSGYTDGEHVYQTVSFADADRIQVVLDYGLTGGQITITEDTDWCGMDCEEGASPNGLYYQLYANNGSSDYQTTGTRTYVFDSDSIVIDMNGWGTPTSGYDYGMYARVYPIYETEQTGTEIASVCEINSTPVSGAYSTTTTWNGKWYAILNGDVIWLESEDEVLTYLKANEHAFLGITINIYAYNAYKIFYNGNNPTAGTMNGFSTVIDTPSHDSFLAAPNFYKTNYGFAGWSEDQNATVNNGARIFGPNELITSTDLSFDSSTHEATVYAVWVPTAGTLQNWNGCSRLGQGRVTALTDSRDGQTYAVAKLADGNCWMIENLRLDANNSSDETKAQGFSGVFTGLANSESSYFTSSTASNSKYSTSIITGNYPGYRFPRYNNSNTSSYTNNMTSTNDNIYGYGNYYTWSAAIANTNHYSSPTAQVDNYTSETVNTSICPFGWRLPYGRSTGNGNTSGGFYYLGVRLNATETYSKEAADAWRKYPINIVKSGYMSSTYAANRGSSARLWSSTADNNMFSYYFSAGNYSFTATPGNLSANKYYGLAVRCLTFGN